VEPLNQIVSRVPATPERETESHNIGVEVLDAWFWPSSDEPGAADTRRGRPEVLEVSLLPPTRRLLRDFPAPGMERPYLEHLEQRIARNPRDLLSHVRRLYLASALDDAGAIMGALADLFLVLGQCGQALKRTLLDLVESQLSAAQHSTLESQFDHDPGAAAFADVPQSRLSKRVIGTTNIVTRADDDAQTSSDPVLLARESTANGQHDVALAVLEGALSSDPGNRAACEELLELYRRHKLESSFFKTYTALLGRKLACRDDWEALAADFRRGAVG